MTVKFIEAQRTGAIGNYEMLCSFMNQEITKVILGQTLTTETGHSGRGSSGGKAAASIHEDVRQDYIKADADMLSNQLNAQLIRWIVDYNFFEVKKYPKLWIRTSQDKDLKPLADRDAVLQKMGLKIPDSYLYETYGIPQPRTGDKTSNPLPASKGARVSTAGGDETFAEHEHHPFPDQKAVDDLAGSIDPEELQKQMEGVLKPVIDLIEKEKDYNKVLSKLAEVYPEMNTSGLEEILARAIFVTELWGRLKGQD